MSSITTIKVYQKTKIKLERFKEYNKESYDDILKKLLYIITVLKENPELGKKLLEEIELAKKRKRELYEKLEPKMAVKH